MIIDKEIVKLAKKSFAFCIWTLLIIYTEPSILSVIFFSGIAFIAWIFLLINFKNQMSEETKEEMTREQIISTVEKITEEVRSKQRDLHILRYDTDTDGSLIFQMCETIQNETFRSDVLNDIARVTKAIEETNICIKSVNIEDDKENNMILVQVNIQTHKES